MDKGGRSTEEKIQNSYFSEGEGGRKQPSPVRSVRSYGRKSPNKKRRGPITKTKNF